MKKEFPVLQTGRLLLRQFTKEDLQNVFKGLSHPEVIKYYGVSYATMEETKIQMQFFKDLETSNTGIWWAICSTDNKIFYGGCGLNNINAQHKKGEIGYWLLTDHWNKGIIREALPLVCDHAFNKVGLHRIEAVIETENESSKKVMAKMGFEYEGTMKDCEIKNGRYISLAMYAKINSL